MDKAIIHGEYSSFKHVKTRKVVTLEIEVPEEYFQDVISKLGMPIGGESKPVAVALLDKGVDTDVPVEKTEGEKLRIRAVMLCKDATFQEFCECDSEEAATSFVREFCQVESRKELVTNIFAQKRFRDLDERYKNQLFTNKYTDNLRRVEDVRSY